jgi:type VI secretion system secreted protein Hcp
MKFSIKPLFQRSLQPLLAATALLIASVSADAAAYIKFDGIDGNCSRTGHKDWSDLLTFSAGASRDESVDTASGMPKLHIEQFVVGKKTDSASPKLMEALCTGKFFASIVIELTRETADGTEETYYRYKLKNVYVTSYNVSGSSSDMPAEELSLNFEEVKATYIDSDGTTGGNVETTWKVEKGE